MSDLTVPDGYELCEDCHGTKYRMVHIVCGDDYSATQSSMEPCRRCGFTGITMTPEQLHGHEKQKS